jgi:hypothetical protein
MRNGTLSVGARHMNGFEFFLGMIKNTGQSIYVIQIGFVCSSTNPVKHGQAVIQVINNAIVVHIDMVFRQKVLSTEANVIIKK